MDRKPPESAAWGPVPWFLATLPAANSEMIARPVVDKALDEHIRLRRAVVVVAPSGFGKTVAVGQWAAKRQASAPGSVAWLTAAVPADGLADLVRGVVTALRHAVRERADARSYRALTAVFESASPVLALAALAKVEASEQVVVVIDDCDKAGEALGDPGFAAFVEHGPSWLRFVLITTEATPALTRLRAHGHVALVSAEELAFTADDVLGLARGGGRLIDTASARAITEATAGWPAAVRLALADGKGPSPRTDCDLGEYIRTAVLGRLRPELADFIVATTVCARADERLARAVSGRDDAARLLAECASSGLFVERFGSGAEAVYQWHSLFLDHCRDLLRQDDPPRWRALNQLAARELRERYPLTAVEHAVRAGDAELANDIVAGHWLELLLQSQTAALESACARVVAAFGDDPEVAMVRSCCREIAGDRLGARMLFDRAQSMASDGSVSRRLRFIGDLTRILISDDHAAMSAAVDAASAALADPAIAPPRVYACACFLAGWAETRLRRDVGRAARLLEAAVHECRSLGLVEVAGRAGESAAFAHAHAGEFGRAELAVRDILAPEPWLTHEGGGVARFTAGFVRFWRGELAAALDDFSVVDAASGVGYPDAGRMMLVFGAASARGRGTAGSLTLAEAAAARIAEADNRGLPMGSFRAASLARLAEARRRPREALDLAATLVGVAPLPMASALVAGVCRRLGDPGLAGALATRANNAAFPPYTRAYATLVLALLEWERGRNEQAHRLLEEALALAAPESVRYPFLDNADDACRSLLAAHAAGTAHTGFLAECLLACEPGHAPERAESLTSREREVLAHMRTPLTAAEIAANLCVSVSTLKTHQRAIYRKLGVANRREAIAAAPR